MMTNRELKVSFETLEAIFTYDRDTGILKRRNENYVGSPVQSKDGKRWKSVLVQGNVIPTSAIFWVLGFGAEMPIPNRIFPRDGNIYNRKLENLSSI